MRQQTACNRFCSLLLRFRQCRTSARRFSGAFGSCSPSLRWSARHRCVDGRRDRNTASAGQQLRVRDQKIQLKPPRCSTHRMLYWSLSSPGITQSLPSAFPAGRKVNPLPQYPGGVFLNVRRRVNQLPSGFPCRTVAPSRCRSLPSPPARRHRRDRVDEI